MTRPFDSNPPPGSGTYDPYGPGGVAYFGPDWGSGPHTPPPPPDITGWGLPPDLAAQMQQMLAQGYSVDEILAYIRGTPWYAQTYPGIQQGISLGLIGNESDYRSYLNQANQLYRRYYGRDITSDEMAGLLASGASLGFIGEQLQTSALYKTMYGEAPGPEELAMLLGSGISPEARLQIGAAYQQLFGRDATASEIGTFLRSGQSPEYLRGLAELYKQYGENLGPDVLSGLLSSGTSLQTVAQQFQGAAYIRAYKPDIQSATGSYGIGNQSRMDKGEMRALGEQVAGRTTPLGYKMQRALNAAMQRMQGIFQGSLATSAGLGIGAAGLSAPRSTAPPDVGA